MAGGGTDFWGVVKLSMIGFFLCIFVIVMLALLVDSLINGQSAVSAEAVSANTEPVGRIYYRPQ